MLNDKPSNKRAALPSSYDLCMCPLVPVSWVPLSWVPAYVSLVPVSPPLVLVKPPKIAPRSAMMTGLLFRFRQVQGDLSFHVVELVANQVAPTDKTRGSGGDPLLSLGTAPNTPIGYMVHKSSRPLPGTGGLFPGPWRILEGADAPWRACYMRVSALVPWRPACDGIPR